MRPILLEPRLILLASAAVFLLATFITPTLQVTRSGYELLAIVDITGSMNVRDYIAGGRPISRLARVKAAIRELIVALPCPSRVALGVFTERRPFLLFEPIDACTNFSPLEAAIGAIDWRMAWEGDSRISAGLFRAVGMARELKTDLLFFTDGQEAPPLPASGGPLFEAKAGETRGLIIGVGGYELSPIPKFDDRGREVGFVAIDEVPHESRFGLPPKGAEEREGFDARNAPFGARAAVGVEHLSSVKEEYLHTLSENTGLGYFHLDDKASLVDAYRAAGSEHARGGALDLRPYLGGVSVACLFAAFSISPLLERIARKRRPARFARKQQ